MAGDSSTASDGPRATRKLQSIELVLGLTLRVFRVLPGTNIDPAVQPSAFGAGLAVVVSPLLAARRDSMSRSPVSPSGWPNLTRPLGRDPLVHQGRHELPCRRHAPPGTCDSGSVRSIVRQLPRPVASTSIAPANSTCIRRPCSGASPPKGRARGVGGRDRRDIAQRLLIGPDLSVAQVARQLGFTPSRAR